jgi:hypothetical protein
MFAPGWKEQNMTIKKRHDTKETITRFPSQSLNEKCAKSTQGNMYVMLQNKKKVEMETFVPLPLRKVLFTIADATRLNETTSYGSVSRSTRLESAGASVVSRSFAVNLDWIWEVVVPDVACVLWRGALKNQCNINVGTKLAGFDY